MDKKARNDPRDLHLKDKERKNMLYCYMFTDEEYKKLRVIPEFLEVIMDINDKRPQSVRLITEPKDMAPIDKTNGDWEYNMETKSIKFK